MPSGLAAPDLLLLRSSQGLTRVRHPSCPITSNPQGVRLEDLSFERILFGFFPTFKDTPLKPTFDRWAARNRTSPRVTAQRSQCYCSVPYSSSRNAAGCWAGIAAWPAAPHPHRLGDCDLLWLRSQPPPRAVGVQSRPSWRSRGRGRGKGRGFFRMLHCATHADSWIGLQLCTAVRIAVQDYPNWRRERAAVAAVLWRLWSADAAPRATHERIR